MSLSIILVNFNTRGLLATCLQSLSEHCAWSTRWW
jgi:hypothetical protein